MRHVKPESEAYRRRDPAPDRRPRSAPHRVAGTVPAAYTQNDPQTPAVPAQKKKGKTAVIVILSIFIVGFLVGLTMLLITLIRAWNEQKTFDDLSNMVLDTDERNDDGSLRKYDELYNKNPDFFGWLKIEGTKIDYPVMYKPEDPEYYLHRDFYGKYSDSGMLFIDGKCPRVSNYYLIYGHHMNNGTMFGELPKYAKVDFYQDHKIIFFDTRYENRDYEVVAAFYGKIYPKEEEKDHFCYYNVKELSSEKEFTDYVKNVKANAIYETGITPKFGDELITLSTCNYHTEDGRFVVVARRIKDTEKKTTSSSSSSQSSSKAK